MTDGIQKTRENALKQIRKRNGTIVAFDESKIVHAVRKAMEEAGEGDLEAAQQVARAVSERLVEKYVSEGVGPIIPGVEEIQDFVEESLMESGFSKAAKHYILYREQHKQLRDMRTAIVGKPTDLKITPNALRVLRDRYLVKDNQGNVIETPEDMFHRVAKNLSIADKLYGATPSEAQKSEESFYELMASLRFLPNAPTLYNAGTPMQQLSACFVLPIEDNLTSIYTTLMHQAIIHASGGGTGFSFSRLRPRGSIVHSTKGIASGPVSFLRVYNSSTQEIKQGGKRRGANMGILSIDHPDILDFINCKTKQGEITNFNISVAITDAFMEAVKKKEDYELIDPKTRAPVRKENAKRMWDLLVSSAWIGGDPGIIFIDRMNRDNPTPKVGMIESTNPCVVGGTLVATENGLERIDSMQTKNITIDQRAFENASAGNTKTALLGCRIVQSSGSFKTGTRPVFLLETQSGFELNATADHRLLTPEGWKPLEKIRPGETVLVQSGKGRFNSNPALPFAPKNTIIGKNARQYRLNLPSQWSRKLGLVLGWLAGDGWISSKHHQVGLVFSKADREAQEIIQPIFEEYCNRKLRIANAKQSAVQIRSNSRFVTEFFLRLGATPAGQEREVPRALYTATEDAVAGFLLGLFSSDGTIACQNESRNYARLNSSSIKLLKGVQLLLLNMGIKSGIYDRSTQPKTFSYESAGGNPKEYHTSGTNYELNISRENLPRFLQKIGFIQTRHRQKAVRVQQHAFYGEYFVEKVKSITPAGTEDVYDLSEPRSHSFIANGIVVHNCGEVPLIAYESCNLGSLVVSKYVENGNILWNDLKRDIHAAVHLLDNVIDMNNYPIKEIEDVTRNGNRKIGLGIMGWAEMLYEMNISYNSEEAIDLAEKLIQFVREEADKASIQLAKVRGPFPNWERSVFHPNGPKYRNATRMSIAPTGEISMIADTSAGIEPVFALSFIKRVMEGQELLYVNDVFKQVAIDRGFYSEALMEKIANLGSIQHLESEIPEDVRRVFVVAHDITPYWHTRMQGVFQKHVDLAISKTVNFPHTATIEDVEEVYMLAYELGCKGVTMYRDGSREGQVLNLTMVDDKGNVKTNEPGKTAPRELEAISKAHGKCPKCSNALVMQEGCATCPHCSTSFCTV